MVALAPAALAACADAGSRASDQAAGPDRTAASAPASPAAVERALERRLRAVPLTVRWVQCVTPRGGAARYRGAAVLRCAANFGAPHMPVYCSTIAGGALVTDRDVGGLRC